MKGLIKRGPLLSSELSNEKVDEEWFAACCV